MIFNQPILPALSTMKEFAQALEYEGDYVVVLDVHLSLLSVMGDFARQAQKKMILHADLVKGLKSDHYAAEFICQVVRPAGIISTRANMLKTAKKHGILAIQRVFLLDTIALKTSYQQMKAIEPDILEVLPGILPDYIKLVKAQSGIDVIAGGLISTSDDVSRALEAGADAVTTSRKDLWTLSKSRFTDLH